MLGRAFGPEDDVAGSDGVGLLSHALWQRRFPGAPGGGSGTVELDGRSITVLGVMPGGFAFPDTDTDVCLPAGIDPANPPGRANHFANLLGRLAPGVPLEVARAELTGPMATWDQEDGPGHHWNDGGHPAFLRPLHEDVGCETRASLFVRLGAVGLVLLIACANVANLLLVHAEGRSHEMSVRSALEAGRGRLVSQLATESLILAAIGGVVGVLVARVGLTSLLAMAPTEIPRLEAVDLDSRVLAFSAGVTLLSALPFGLAPAFRALRTDLRDALHGDGVRGTAGKRRLRLRGLTVVSQIALAIMLLIGGGLLLRSFGNLADVDPGFRGTSVVSVSLSLPQAGYPRHTLRA